MKRKHPKPDRTGRSYRGEHFAKILRDTMETPAWKALSSSAQAAWPWFKLEWRGPDANNNGRIRLSVRQLAKQMGCGKDAASRAVHDLQAKGFLVVTEVARLGTGGDAQGHAFELTEVALPGSHSPRKLFASWRKGADFPVTLAATHNPSGRNGNAKPCPEDRDGTVTTLRTVGPGASAF